MEKAPSHALDHERKILDYAGVLEKLRREQTQGLWSDEEFAFLEGKLKQLKEHTFANLSPWQRIQISRHPSRPKGLQVIQGLSSSFEELFGDRLFRDDPAIVGGLAQIGDVKVMCIAQEKGTDLDSRLHRNFGMMQPDGYRKALRLMRLAEKFQLPVLCIIDTPGAYAGLEAEERGQGWAIAENLKAMATLRTPVVGLVLSEGCSGGALGIGVSDCMGMLEHAYYSVISPEGCASILWKDTSKKEEAASALKLTSEDLLKLGLIDEVLTEPLGGAHHDEKQVYADIKEFFLRWHKRLRKYSHDELLERRYEKFRQMGQFSQMGGSQV